MSQGNKAESGREHQTSFFGLFMLTNGCVYLHAQTHAHVSQSHASRFQSHPKARCFGRQECLCWCCMICRIPEQAASDMGLRQRQTSTGSQGSSETEMSPLDQRSSDRSWQQLVHQDSRLVGLFSNRFAGTWPFQKVNDLVGCLLCSKWLPWAYFVQTTDNN